MNTSMEIAILEGNYCLVHKKKIKAIIMKNQRTSAEFCFKSKTTAGFYCYQEICIDEENVCHYRNINSKAFLFSYQNTY